MNDFIFNVPIKVYFGKDQLGNLGAELAKHGKRVLLTYGGGSIKRSGLYDAVVAQIRDAGLELFELSGIEPNPRIDSVRKGAALCKEEGIDVLLAVGGGSVIDATKFIAAGACVDFDPWEFFSEHKKIEKALPIVTVLTLAATGSEMNRGGVISNPDTKEKLGYAGVPLLPRASFLDPTNTYTVSEYQTACGSADILSHTMEVYFGTEPGLYLVDCFMEGLMKTVIKYAPIAMKEPDNYEARANLMWAASWAINGFIAAGKRTAWSCHPMEHELSAFYDMTHGHGLAILSPRWLEYCLDESNVARYVSFGVNVFGIDPTLEPMEIARRSIDKLSAFLFDTLKLQRSLSDMGIDDRDFSEMARKACGGKAIWGFKPLRQADIEKIYRMCL